MLHIMRLRCHPSVLAHCTTCMIKKSTPARFAHLPGSLGSECVEAVRTPSPQQNMHIYKLEGQTVDDHLYRYINGSKRYIYNTLQTSCNTLHYPSLLFWRLHAGYPNLPRLTTALYFETSNDRSQILVGLDLDEAAHGLTCPSIEFDLILLAN